MKAIPKKTKMMKSLARDQRGAGFVEYMIITAVVALASIGAFTNFGKDVQSKIKDQGSAVGGIKW